LPLRVFRREPYRLFGSPIPLRCFYTLEVFRARVASHFPKKTGCPLSGSRPSSETPVGAARACASNNAVACFRAPPVRFCSPYSVRGAVNRLSTGSIRSPSLLDLSQVLEGLILTVLAALFHAADALGVETLQSFPYCRALPDSSPGDAFSTFPPPLAGMAASSRLCSRQQSVSDVRVLHLKPNRSSLGLSRFHGVLPLQVGAVFPRLIRSWLLLRSPSRSSSKSAFSVFMPGWLAFSALAECRPS
jgi:hypothetical protein